MTRSARAAAMLLMILASCGDGGAARTSDTASSATNAAAFVAGHLPDGYVIVSADERDGRRSVGYAPSERDEYRILITVSAPSAAPATGRDPRTTRVRGHDATLLTLTDEGHEYGRTVSWDERPDLRIVVEGSDGPTEDETLAVAEAVRGVSQEEWQRLTRALSIDTHVGRVDATATPLEVLRGAIGNDTYTLTALVPGDYPLGPEDRRADCFHLAFRGDTTKDLCPVHPIWKRVGGQLFAFGFADGDIDRLNVAPIDGSFFEPFSVDTAAPTAGPRVRFYVAVLPDDACAVSITDATNLQRGPGSTGPLDNDGADRTRCLALFSDTQTGPPTTAN